MSKTVVFDVETGGLDPERHAVIQFAAVVVDSNWQEVDSMEVKVRFDPTEADASALEKNRYNADVWEREAKPVAQALSLIDAFLRRHSDMQKVSRAGKPYRVARLCAHNAKFDGDFLAAWFKRAGLFCPAACFEALDTLALARWSSLRSPSAPRDHKLASLCEWLGVPLEEAHDALADVRATVEVARRLLPQMREAAA